MATKINSEFRMVGIKHSKSSLGTSHLHLLTREVRGRGWGMKRGRGRGDLGGHVVFKGTVWD